MKINFKGKLFLYFVIIFFTFTVGVILLQQYREKTYRFTSLEGKLNAYADMTCRVYNREQADGIDSLLPTLPQNIRLTIIDREGKVLYDNAIGNVAAMENHALRPEIRDADKEMTGYDIRISSSNELEYIYYAKSYPGFFVRVALPYDVQVRHFLKSDNLFLYYIVALFIITLFLINYASGRFGKSIRKLKDFTDIAEEGTIDIQSMSFPDDELGEIGTKIAQNYNRLRESRKEIILEREKLLQHVHSSEEGLCFFSPEREVEFYNGLFIQYLNTIINDANSDPLTIFTENAFEQVVSFLDLHEDTEKYFETRIQKQGKSFAVRVNIFDDKSFETIINDVTTQEKTQLLKQEMTGNITHELRTPVTSIRGCLETVLQHDLTPEKKDYFITNAYRQVLSLSELIQDMGLITRMGEAPLSFHSEDIDIPSLLVNLKNDLEIPLRDKNIRMQWTLPEREIVVDGNRNLVYSIFRNLTDNVIRYAGEDVDIHIGIYNEDKQFYYFSYADTGIGIPEEQHLNRLFERFYRINEGRTRDTGGSGLGLSIVKNAVNFHKGTIIVKNKAAGGLEFLFNLPKSVGS